MWGVTMAEAEEACRLLLEVTDMGDRHFPPSWWGAGTAYSPSQKPLFEIHTSSPFHLVALDCPKCGIPVDPLVAGQLRAGGVSSCQGCGMTLVGER